MNIVKFLARRRLLGLALIVGFSAAACVPFRQEASWPTMSVAGDGQGIFLAYNDRVVMVNAEDGTPVRLRNPDGEIRLDENGNARIWEFTGGDAPAPNQFYASPVPLDESTLLISTYTQRLFEVDVQRAAATNGAGAELPGQVLETPLLYNDMLYLGADRNLVALDAESQAELWTIPTGQGVWSQPVVIEEVLYFTSLDHFLYAVAPESGEILWTLDLQGAAPESPVFYEGRLFVGSFARKLFEVSLDGEILSEFSTVDWVWSRPSIADGVLYASDLSGHLYALDVADGGFNELWRTQVTESSLRASPLVSDEYVIVGSRDHKVYWVDREDGTIFFSRDVAGEVVSDMLLVEPGEDLSIEEPYVVVSTLANEELMVALSLQNGERMWTYGR